MLLLTSALWVVQASAQQNDDTAANVYFQEVWNKLTNPKNQQFVVVKINDRMHNSMSKKGRIVVLTRVAAKEIGKFKQGIGKVLVQKVEKLPNK